MEVDLLVVAVGELGHQADDEVDAARSPGCSR